MGEVVEFEVFEGTKENLQPLKKGRNLAVLKHLVDKDPKATEEELEAQRCAHEEKIKTYDGDDPLMPWLDFIAWTQQAYASGGTRSMLIQLLEKCTKEFQHHERYRNSDKYLRVWIIYADNLREPEEVFSFLQHNEIGQKRSLFYEAYALTLESKGKAAQALEILEQGVNMQAEPAAKIKVAFKNAQARMVRRTEQMLQAQNDPFGMPTRHEAKDDVGERQVLSRINKKRAIVPTQPASNTLQLTKQPQKNARFEVFCDSEATGSGEHPTAVWDELHSRASKEKENTQAATTWNSSALPSQAKHANKPHHKPVADFDVYVDEGCVVETAPTAPNATIMALRAIDLVEQKNALAAIMDARLAQNSNNSMEDVNLSTTSNDELDTPMVVSLPSSSSERAPPSPLIASTPLVAPSPLTAPLIAPSPLVTSTLIAPSPFPVAPSSAMAASLIAPSPAIAASALLAPSPLLASSLLLPSPIPSGKEATQDDLNSMLPSPLLPSPVPVVAPKPKPKRALVFEDEDPFVEAKRTSAVSARASAAAASVPIPPSRPSSSSTASYSSFPSSSSSFAVPRPASKPTNKPLAGAKSTASSFTVFCDEPEPPKQKKGGKDMKDLLDFGDLLD